jgi:hypothetical protein
VVVRQDERIDFLHDTFRAYFAGVSLRHYTGPADNFDRLPEDPPELWTALARRVSQDVERWLWPAAFFAGTLRPGEAREVVKAFFAVDHPPPQVADFLLIVLENGEHPFDGPPQLPELLALLRDHRVRVAPEGIYAAARQWLGEKTVSAPVHLRSLASTDDA